MNDELDTLLTALYVKIDDELEYGAGGRADYAERPGDPDRWDWQGDVP
ncbi:hypothetical protein OOK13_40935 [Streptomyces sp. NBC_00378]|nr:MULTISPECIES: hypothetical protein [unclassified Streptomyces]MCX5114723.1 hypothetical protein [Streptomyces sp. NBC_00378]